MTSFSDLFKLGKEVLKTETFVLHEAETRGADGGVCARYIDGNQNSRCSACVLLCRLVSPLLHVRMAVRFGLAARARIFIRHPPSSRDTTQFSSRPCTGNSKRSQVLKSRSQAASSRSTMLLYVSFATSRVPKSLIAPFLVVACHHRCCRRPKMPREVLVRVRSDQGRESAGKRRRAHLQKGQAPGLVGASGRHSRTRGGTTNLTFSFSKFSFVLMHTTNDYLHGPIFMCPPERSLLFGISFPGEKQGEKAARPDGLVGVFSYFSATTALRTRTTAYDRVSCLRSRVVPTIFIRKNKYLAEKHRSRINLILRGCAPGPNLC